MAPISVRFRFGAERRNLGWLRQALGSLLVADGGGSFSRQDVDEILLAVQETVVNVLKHAYGADGGDGGDGGAGGRGGTVDLRVVVRGGRFVARVRDRGRPFDAAALAEPDPALPRESGNGVFLARTFMDVVRYGRRGRTNFVHLERSARGALAAAESRP